MLSDVRDFFSLSFKITSLKEEQGFSAFRVDDSIRIGQINKLKKMKKLRDVDKVNSALAALEASARGNDNTMPYLIEAVESYATLGEIANIFRNVFGEYKN